MEFDWSVYSKVYQKYHSIKIYQKIWKNSSKKPVFIFKILLYVDVGLLSRVAQTKPTNTFNKILPITKVSLFANKLILYPWIKNTCR